MKAQKSKQAQIAAAAARKNELYGKAVKMKQKAVECMRDEKRKILVVEAALEEEKNGRDHHTRAASNNTSFVRKQLLLEKNRWQLLVISLS